MKEKRTMTKKEREKDEESTMNSNHRHHHPNEPVFYARTVFRTEHRRAPLNKQNKDAREDWNMPKSRGRKERDTLGDSTRLDGKTNRRQSSSLHNERERFNTLHTIHPVSVEVSVLVVTSLSTHEGGLSDSFQLFNIVFAYKNRLTLTDGFQYTQPSCRRR